MSVERIDRYTISVDGIHVTAPPETEERIRAMTPDERRRFVTIMGGTPREDVTHTHLTVGVTRGCPACEQVAQALPGGESS